MSDEWDDAWEAMERGVVRELRRFCRLGAGSASPTRDELRDAIRDVFPRLGWCMMRVGHPTEWADFLDALREVTGSWPTVDPAEVRPRSAYHRHVACAVKLGVVHAPWALDPAPWRDHTGPWPGVSPGIVPVLPMPPGWPR